MNNGEHGCGAQDESGDHTLLQDTTREPRSFRAESNNSIANFPERLRASAAVKPGEYDARRLRSQREIIRDVMLSAGECETWLTLGELRALTRYGEASISAQLRHLRKAENGGYAIEKRHREGVGPERPGADGRSERVWEYRLGRGTDGAEERATRGVVCGAVA